MKPWLAVILILLSAGCRDESSGPAEDSSRSAESPSKFDSSNAGSVHGLVKWGGPAPQVPRLEIASAVPGPRLVVDAPNTPRIEPGSAGVAGAVIFLRQIDPRSARPWDHAPVSVEFRGRQMLVLQGTAASSIGFVRRGDSFEFVSREPIFNSLHASGASYFTIPMPDPDRALTRTLRTQGLVELSSAAGWYWMRGYLFIADHPYYCRTDPAGCYTLPDVPPGRYQIVCWLPNWKVLREERDTETSMVVRSFLRPPVELEQTVEVLPRAMPSVDFTLKTEMFTR